MVSIIMENTLSLYTDGKSNRGNLNSAITRLRNTDTQVYVVGIGNIDITQLRAIATDPDNEHVFILRNYLDAAGFVDILSATTCDSKLGWTRMNGQRTVAHILFSLKLA